MLLTLVLKLPGITGISYRKGMNQAGGQRVWHIQVADVAEATTMCKDSKQDSKEWLKPGYYGPSNNVKTFELIPEVNGEDLQQGSEAIVAGQGTQVATIY